MPYQLTVNGVAHALDVPGFQPLVLVLRDELGLTGTKIGCFEGRCGACTVQLDGEPVCSCLLPLALAAGRSVQTIEGLSAAGLHPLQRALLDAGGVQCGACTPGIVMALAAFVDATPAPAEEDVREALEGNICRCTGYRKILDAALAAARESKSLLQAEVAR